MAKEIPLTRGLVAIVDDEDYERLAKFNWHALKTRNGFFYAARWCRRKCIQMHHEVMRCRVLVDHMDGDRLNNRKNNLRRATHSENVHNRRCSSRSGLKGVSMVRNKWRAVIYTSGGKKHIGMYESCEAAVAAYNAAAQKYHGKFAWVNGRTENVPPPGSPPRKYFRRPRGRLKVRGVSWDKTREAYLARISVSGRVVNLGRFKTVSEAARAYDEAAVRLVGSGAWLNRDHGVY